MNNFDEYKFIAARNDYIEALKNERDRQVRARNEAMFAKKDGTLLKLQGYINALDFCENLFIETIAAINRVWDSRQEAASE